MDGGAKRKSHGKGTQYKAECLSLLWEMRSFSPLKHWRKWKWKDWQLGVHTDLKYLSKGRKKIMKLNCHTNDCLDVHYLSGYMLCTKMVCMECKPGAVNTVLTMLGSHPPSSPFSEQSFCADSIFLWMLLNRWLQSAVGENLWNKQMPPEITIKPMSIYADEGKTTLHQKGIILLLLTLTFNYIIFLFCWKKCRCMWIQI